MIYSCHIYCLESSTNATMVRLNNLSASPLLDLFIGFSPD